MKKLLLCLSLLLLSGCMYQTIDQTDLANANDACKDKEGVFSITEVFVGLTSATCRNGLRFSIDSYERKSQ